MYTVCLFVVCCSLYVHRIEYTPLHTQDEYVPEERGLRHELPDGVDVRVRLHRVHDIYQVTRCHLSLLCDMTIRRVRVHCHIAV